MERPRRWRWGSTREAVSGFRAGAAAAFRACTSTPPVQYSLVPVRINLDIDTFSSNDDEENSHRRSLCAHAYGRRDLGPERQRQWGGRLSQAAVAPNVAGGPGPGADAGERRI